MPNNKKHYSPDRPGVYVIIARGYLEESWFEYLGELTIGFHRQPEGELLTSLTGELSDQGALMGVLNTLSDHHAALLLVARTSSLQGRELIGMISGPVVI